MLPTKDENGFLDRRTGRAGSIGQVYESGESDQTIGYDSLPFTLSILRVLGARRSPSLVECIRQTAVEILSEFRYLIVRVGDQKAKFSIVLMMLFEYPSPPKFTL